MCQTVTPMPVWLCVSDWELGCLATWKDGSDTYLYGRFSGPGVLDKNSAYRCFVSENTYRYILIASLC